MIDQGFCSFLEYELSKAFSNSIDRKIKGFWCDGVLLPDSANEISKKYINDRREVVMTVFLGTDGQEKYTLILKFGNRSLSCYARDLDIKKCMPATTEDDWYHIDIPGKTLSIYLL